MPRRDAPESEPMRNIVAREVRQQIIAGHLKPGDRLREEPLAKEHGASRTPTREALQLLAQEGFVEIAPRRGATVAFPSARKTRELMVIRESLELVAARGAARRKGGEYAAELTTVLDQGSDALARRAFAELPPLIERFHEIVALASGNEELARLLRSLRARVRWVFEMRLEQRSDASWRLHREIAQAVLDGDIEAAERVMHQDVTRDGDLLVDLLLERADAVTTKR